MNSTSSDVNDSDDFSAFAPEDFSKKGFSDWTYSMRREMQEIIPGLYLGPFSAATKTKLQTLEEAGITHIICVRHDLEASFIQPNFPEKFVYSIINLADANTTNIIPFLPRVKEFIDECLRTGGKVLVHGNAGISRSAALVIGYIMETKGLAYMEAFALVQFKRQCISPSEGFMHQLKEYEPIYKAKRTLLNGHTSKVTGKLKRRIDQLEESAGDMCNNKMDICDEAGT